MQVSKKEYGKMAKKASPGTGFFKNAVWAFFVGGAICCVGQGLTNLYMFYGSELKDARSLTSVTLIGAAAVFTALKVYDNLAKHAGAGTLVPITGFANSIVAPAMEFKSEGYVIGIGGKMFVIAGPVLVYGIAASIVYGLIVWSFHLY